MTSSSEDGCMTLTEFLLARIAEDKAAAGEPDPDEIEAWRIEASGHEWPKISPARVLAECEAKRQIVALHRLSDGADVCVLCTGPGIEWWPCPTMKAVARPYADHPDYRDEWRP